MSRVKDETGNRYGRLLVESRALNKIGQHAKWNVLCDCGNRKIVSGEKLRKGDVKSCGCFWTDTMVKNEIGNRYEKLLVLERDGSNRNRATWKCQCDCGNIISVVGEYLRNGDTKSCGCVKSSAEEAIGKVLQDFNIDYKTQYTFFDLVSDKGYNLKFDFAIFKNNKLSHLIEYDGVQHYQQSNKWHTNTLIKHDKLKNEYCKKNNIKLLRFRSYENLTIEDLV